MLGDDDLAAALAGMRTNLAEDGLLVFDVNSKSTYVPGYAERREVEHDGSRWVWDGRGEISPFIFEAEISGDRLDAPIAHLERFRPKDEVLETMRSSGIRPLASLGMREADGKVVLAEPDENRDYKLVFIGARSEA